MSMTKENIIESNNTNLSGGGNPIMNLFSYINHHVMYLNNSKFFAGIVMILLNVGSNPSIEIFVIFSSRVPWNHCISFIEETFAISFFLASE